jgi:hypothetical protein
MPIYDFINTETGEQFSKLLSMSARESFLADNPNVRQQILGAPSMVSGVNLESKQDAGWKENLSRIAAAHPNSTLAEKVGGRDSKTVKVKQIANKHGFGKAGSTTD